jgi:hypothetical protein
MEEIETMGPVLTGIIFMRLLEATRILVVAIPWISNSQQYSACHKSSQVCQLEHGIRCAEGLTQQLDVLKHIL